MPHPPLELASTTVRTVIERLSHHRLILVFIITAFAQAFFLSLFQGEALSVSQSGVNVLNQIHRAPELGLLAITCDCSGAVNDVNGVQRRQCDIGVDEGRTFIAIHDNLNSNLDSLAAFFFTNHRRVDIYTTELLHRLFIPENYDHLLAVTGGCVEALESPTVYIKRLQTMSTAFIFFEFWILLLSISGVLYESVPHIGSVAVAHVLALVYCR
ncbi:hypothetical protein RQP46_008289 [Phenoliferia psychrophenolica]